MDPITIDFEVEKETPGTIKFKEVTPRGEAPISGSFYVKKYVAERLGNPQRLTLTVTVKA